MNDLPLQVGHIHDIGIDNAERAHPSGSQVVGGRRAQATRPHQQHLGIEQFALAFFANLTEQEMTAVALELLVGHLAIANDRIACILPPGDAAGHGIDILVTHLAHDSAG